MENRVGRLKIFLGYAAGVGKTYAMLEMARQRKNEGKDVVIGIALTHGRKETQKLLEGFEIIPLAKIVYKNISLEELDLDHILRRRPEIVIVDELAHTNVAGSRHTKRYMDVEELLREGIDVYTTLNIQHLESYQDSIEKATGVVIKERVPDTIVEEADEIELVDLPPEDLLERLHQGKIYLPDQAERAIHKFFKRENLQLLREISLRKTASIVDTDRAKVEIAHLRTNVAPRLLASIGPSPFSERVIRVTKRLADMLHAEWIVVSVALPDAQVPSEEQTRQLTKNFHLAEELGATVVILPGESIADTIFDYAKSHNITQIILGHSLRSWYQRFFFQSPVDELVRKDGAIDIYVISSAFDEGMHVVPFKKVEKKIDYFECARWLLTPFLLMGVFSFILFSGKDFLSQTSLSYIYILFSVLMASFLPLSQFLLSMGLSIFVYEAIFLADIATVDISLDSFVFIAAATILGLTINYVAIRYKRLSRMAIARHQETLQLFELAKDLAGAKTPKIVLQKFNSHLYGLIQAQAVLCMRNDGFYGGTIPFDATEQIAAHWSMEHSQVSGKGTDTLPSAKGFFLPLVVSGHCIGALGIYSLEQEGDLSGYKHLLEALAHLVALSLDKNQL